MELEKSHRNLRDTIDATRVLECESSLIQQMRYMQYLSAPTGAAYNVNFLAALGDDADVEGLERSVHALMRRHAILRTTYTLRAGQVFQRIAVDEPQVVRVVDTQSWTSSELEVWIAQEADRPFDLRRGPILRINILCRSGKPHRLQVVVHHIAMDYRSWAIFCGELAALYSGFVAHRPTALPDLRVTYEQYARAQRVWIESRSGQASREFWSTTLAGALPVLSLPLDRPYPPSPSFQGNTILALICADRVEALRKRVASFRFVTPSIFVLACLALWLKNVCRQNELVIGLATNDRQVAGASEVLGDFVNTVPIRLNLTERVGFDAAVAHVRDRVLSALKHRRVPLISMLSELDIGRMGGASPLFQVLFTWNRVPTGDSDSAAGAQPFQWLTGSSTGTSGCTHEISLMILEEPECLKLQWAFNNAIFEPGTQRALADGFSEFIESVLSGRSADAKSELWATVCRWNKTEAEFPRAACMHQLIEAQVKRLPGQVAVIVPGNACWSYEDLNGRANQLAGYLIAQGVRSDTIVALYLHRSVEMVIAILAVLKAGGAYLPIDPETPLSRCEYLIEDADPCVVLTQRHLSDRVSSLKAPMFALDTAESEQCLARYSAVDLPHADLRSDNLAYVIYTSGSTGEPKGVQVEHRALVNRIWWMQQSYPLTPIDRVLQKTPYVFDVSVWEFMWPLMTGASIVVARPGGHHDPGYLVSVIKESSVSVAHFVPSMLYPVLDEPQWTSCKSLRLVFCSGEALPLDLQSRFFRHADGPELHNLYGPTEAAIDVSFWACTPAPGQAQVPIGRPISNTKLYILDSNAELLPIGSEGELYIGGVCLARGYLNKPELTAERFVANPLPDGNDRLYKTGDLARHRADGAIEYLGRLDHQVKIRGLRVELGEIETALLQCEGIERALADSIDGPQGQKLLVAWVVLAASATWSPESASAKLSELLPAYAVPAIIKPVEKFPLTVTGKADRSELRRGIRYEASTQYCPPQTDIEHVLASIWQRVLGVERIGIDDNYFELGGDSILSLRIGPAAREAGIHFEIDQLMALRTIRKLAAVCKPCVPAGSAANAANGWTGDTYPLSALQVGIVYHSILFSGTSVYHDVFRYHIQGEFDAQSMEYALDTLVQEHELLRTSFELDAEPEPLQRVSPEVRCPLQVRDLSSMPTQEQERVLETWANTERANAFDWGTAPLLRLFVHVLSPSRFELTVSFSHAILDGWSISVFVTELLKRANKGRPGEPAHTLQPHTPFRRFIEMERAALASEESRLFWKQALSGAPKPLCTDRIRGEMPEGALGTVTLTIDESVSKGLDHLAHSLGESIRSVLLAAHLKTLSLFFNTSDVMSGLVLNGRPEAHDAESLLGLFLNTVPFRIHVGDSPSATLVERIAAHERSVFPHRRVPLKTIQEWGDGQTPFDAVFNFVHFYRYGEIGSPAGWRILDHRVFEETNFPLLANFLRELDSPGLRLQLSYRERWFSQQQIASLGELYKRVLRAFSDGSAICDLADLRTHFFAVDSATRIFKDPQKLDFWAERLRGIRETHELPFDAVRLPDQPPRFESLSEALGNELLRDCGAVAHQYHASLAQICLAAFAVLVGRFSRSDEAVIGTPAGISLETSTKETLLSVAGWLLRANVNAQRSFSDILLETVVAACESSYHTNIHLPQLAKCLGHSESPAHPPVCQLYFDLRSDQTGSSHDSTHLRDFPPFELCLTIQTPPLGSDSDATCIFHFDASLFSAGTVKQLAVSYKSLLRSITQEPSARVVELHWGNTSPENECAPGIQEQAGILEEWVHERIHLHAGVAPNRTAVVSGDTILSYGELESCANRLANVLRDLGVERESKVGICLPRGGQLIVAILGVLKAGGAYVPLDPAHPAARLQFIAHDAGLRLTITVNSTAALLSAIGVTCLRLDDKDVERRLEESSPELPLANRASGSDLCYVMYTSGSSGTPKGVMIEHRNVARLFTTCQSLFDFRPDEVWTLFHSYAFDFSVWEIFGTLTSGGKLVVVPERVIRAPREFLDLLVAQRVTVLNQTPSAFFNLLTAFSAESWSRHCLRYVIFGGEALEPRKLRPVLAKNGSDRTTFINMYGITETTVHVTFKRLAEQDMIVGVSAIGTPLPDLAVQVVDEQLMPVPRGARGELCVSGRGVARGYLNLPELTQQRFVESRLMPGTLCYLSGDLARIGSSGELQYLGRADRQVKIRGFRIELGEIENQIVEVSEGAVPNAVVVAVEDPDGPQRLAAYVVRSTENREYRWQRRLRERLRAVLPEHMVPSFMLGIEAIPLTANGKIDLAALPKHPHTLDVSEYVAPRTPLEESLVGVYEAVLHVSPIGVTDDYFALGGDSIRVVQLVTRAESLGFSLEGMDILRNPTIEKLAQLLERGERTGKLRRPIPLSLVVREQWSDDDTVQDCYAVSEVQQLMLSKHQLIRGGVYHPLHVFRITDPELDVEALRAAINRYLGGHAVMRSNFHDRGDGTYAQCVHTTAEVHFTVQDASILPPAEQEGLLDSYLEQELNTPFDVGRAPPLMRFHLLACGNAVGYFVISSHHAIEDGWGFVEMLKGVMRLYSARQTDTPQADIEAHPDVFKERLALEHEAACDPQATAVWEAILSQAAEYALPLPRVPCAPTGQWTHCLSIQETTRLHSLARQARCPLKSIFMLAYMDALSHLLKRDKVMVDVIASGRTHRLSAPTSAMGLFWNLLPIPFQVDKDISWKSLRALNAQLLRAEEFSTYPVMRIARQKGLEGFTPAAFNYMHFHNVEPDSQSRFELVRVFDRFHHAIKLAVTIEPDGSRAQLQIDFDPTWLVPESLGGFTDSLRRALEALSSLQE